MTLSNLTAYTSIPDNSAATPGLFDYRFNTLHQNVSAVDTTVSQVSTTLSVISGSGISGFISVQAPTNGAKGDGTTDDRAAFVSANSSTATQNILYVPSAVSRYKIASSVTIAGTFYPVAGGVLRPSSNQTLYVTGPIEAGSYQWIDLAGGAVDFSKNHTIRRFDARWFGILGDGVTDDQPALVSMVSMLPDDATVVFPGNARVNIASTWTVTLRNRLRFVTEQGPHLNGSTNDTAAAFLWSGATGGRMIVFDRCTRVALKGFALFGKGIADVGIDLDGDNSSPGGGQGTGCEIEDVSINGGGTRTFACVRISNTAIQNQDFHKLTRCTLTPSTSIGANTTAAITSGSSKVVFGTALFTSGDLSIYSGFRVLIYGAGSSVLSTSVLSVSDNSTAILRDNATSTTTNGLARVGQAFGYGLQIGTSSNAKQVHAIQCQFNGAENGVRQQQGSLELVSPWFSHNETDIYLTGSSDPVIIIGGAGENSARKLYAKGSSPIVFVGHNIDYSNVGPGMGFVEIDGPQPTLVLNGCQVARSGGGLPTGSSIFSSVGAQTPTVLRQGTYYFPSVTTTELGDGDFASGRGLISIGENGITGAGLVNNWTNTALAIAVAPSVNGAVGTALTGEARTFGDLTTASAIGVLGRIGGGSGTPSLPGAAVQGEIISGAAHPDSVALRALLPTWTAGQFPKLTGLRVESPAVSAGGSAITVVGVQIRAQAAPGFITTPYAELQEGVSDYRVYMAPSHGTGGSGLWPTYTFSSESSLGWYRSGVSTLAPSYGTLNLASNSVRLSMRTTGSLDSTNLAVNEVAFSVLGASGATLAIRSGGTIWYFNSSASTKG